MRKIAIADWEVTSRQRGLVNDALNSGRLSYGPITEQFEKKFAEIHDQKFALFMNSGTSALQVALDALKKKYADKIEAGRDGVLVPAITFVASINVIIQNGLKPILVDVSSTYYDIDLDTGIPGVDKAFAVMPVHLFGQPADMDRVMEFAKKHDLAVIEDACESPYTTKPRGEIACYSTYMAHPLVTGVGGLATTNDPELAVMMRSLMFHGRDGIYLKMEDDDEYSKEVVERRFKFDYVGYSYRATEMEAALGLGALDNWEEVLDKRMAVGTAITDRLGWHSKRLQLPAIREGNMHCFMLYPIIVTDMSIDRDDLMQFLEQKGIETRHMMPITNQPVYKDLFKEEDYPVAMAINNRGLIIGSHDRLEEEDIEYIGSVFDEYLNKYK